MQHLSNTGKSSPEGHSPDDTVPGMLTEFDEMDLLDKNPTSPPKTPNKFESEGLVQATTDTAIEGTRVGKSRAASYSSSLAGLDLGGYSKDEAHKVSFPTTQGPGSTSSSPINIRSPAESKGEDSANRAKYPSMIGNAEEEMLRKWATGRPAKMFPPVPPSVSLQDTSPRRRSQRRSTLADKPELDHILASTLKEYKGVLHLPLTAHTLKKLSPLSKGAKPIADFSIFERLLVTKEINGPHADHVVAALQYIGAHCKHLVIVAPIHMAEYGDVLRREQDDINTGNDWVQILKCFPNLETLAIDNPKDELPELTRETVRNVFDAVDKLGLKHLKAVSHSVPLHAVAE